MNKSNDERIAELEGKIFSLEYQLIVMRNILSVKTRPDWATTSLNKAYKIGLRESPYGESLDSCRIITLLDSLNLLPQQIE